MPIIKTLKNGQWTPVNSVTSLGTATPSTAGLMSASDKEKLDDSVDYIVEQGTDGMWTYRKWNSGVAECWGNATETNKAMTNSEGSGYFASANTYNYPTNLFTETPTLNVTTQCTGRLTAFGLSTQDSARFVGYYWSTISATATIYGWFRAIGKWK